MTQWCFSFPDSYDLFGHSILLLTWYDPLWAFDSSWFDPKRDLNQLMTQAVSRKLESIQLVIQAAFQELTQNQLMIQVDSQVLIPIDSWLKMLPKFPIQISSWLAKNIRFLVDHDSTLSHTHVCTWNQLKCWWVKLEYWFQENRLRKLGSLELEPGSLDQLDWATGSLQTKSAGWKARSGRVGQVRETRVRCEVAGFKGARAKEARVMHSRPGGPSQVDRERKIGRDELESGRYR